MNDKLKSYSRSLLAQAALLDASIDVDNLCEAGDCRKNIELIIADMRPVLLREQTIQFAKKVEVK